MNLVYRSIPTITALGTVALLSSSIFAAEANRKPAFAPARAAATTSAPAPATPAAAPGATASRERLIQFGPAAGQVTPVTITPRTGKPIKSPDTSFKLSPAGPGKLLLAFEATNPQYELSTQGGFVIQLATDEGVTITPSLITRENWPKDNKLTLSYSGAIPPGEPMIVQGKAVYSACDKRTKNCKKVLSPFSLEVGATGTR